MRRFTLLFAGVALSVATLTACLGGPPPPPPTDPRDVLVVGDSMSFPFGCALGNGLACTPRPGYTTYSEYHGGCTITPGTLLLYNGGTAPAPNCHTVVDDHGRTWEQAADLFVPKVVVIKTAGWEIVDRWINSGSPPPDAQWGGPTGPGSAQETAAVYYSSMLYNAITMFRSKGAKVVVANAPYTDPPEALGTPTDPCQWWEPYDASPPSAPPGSACPGIWSPPAAGVTYRSSKAKMDQFNTVIDIVKNVYFPDDDNVLVFDFKKHFNGPDNVYTDYVCPPPNDATVAPDPVTHDCEITVPSPGTVPAVLARGPDGGHLTAGGTFEILQPYLEPCVKALIPVPGGDQSKCS